MNRTLSGARSRVGTLLTLAGVSAVVVAGTVTVVGFADRSGASAMLTAPLLLLGIVAVPATGRELGSVRREEIGVARLRGLQGPDLVRMLSAEPLLAILAGTVAGCLIGVLGMRATTAAWLSQSTWWPGWAAMLAAFGVAVLALGAVWVGMAAAVREPLADQVSLAERPRRSSTPAVFGSLLVVVAAAVAVYRSGVAHAGDPDGVVLLGPALVGLAAGQVAVWLLGLMTRLAVQRSNESELPLYLAVRRLRGTAAVGSPVRLLVAGTVIATLALAGSARVTEWSDDTARLRVGAPIQVPLDLGALAALQLTRRLDPEGRWLMAGASVLDSGGGAGRRAYLDLSRYDAVVGRFLDETPAAGLPAQLSAFGADLPGEGDRVSIARGGWLRIAFSTVQTGAGLVATVAVSYVNDQGFLNTTTVVAPLRGPHVGIRARTRLPDCRVACVATSVTARVGDLTRAGVVHVRGGSAPVLFTRIDLGDLDLLALPWQPEPRAGDGEEPLGPAGLTLGREARGVVTLAGSPGPLRVLTTAGLRWPEEGQLAKTPGGTERPVTVSGQVTALPFVESEGVLADLSEALVADEPTVPTATVVVLARADTPVALLAGLAAAGGGSPRSLAQVREQLVESTGAAQARAYALMAGSCLLVALLVLLASQARQRAARTREVAALRLLGVTPAQMRRSGRAELVGMVTATVSLGVAAGILAVQWLLGALPLISVPEYAVPLGLGVPAWVPVLTGTAAAAALLAVGLGAQRQRPELTRPSTLREEAGV